MKVPRKLDYACRILIQLATHYGGQNLARLDELSKLEAVPRDFLVQILIDLKKAGLVDSRRGKSGGYLLSLDPHQITLHQIILAIDGALWESEDHQLGQSAAKSEAAWRSIRQAIANEAKSITLASLAGSDLEWYI